MANVTQEMFSCPDASVSVTFNDANGSIGSISWTVNAGTLVMTIIKNGQNPIVVTKTTSGTQNIPNNYNLTKGPKGDWKWQGDPAFEISWVGN